MPHKDPEQDRAWHRARWPVHRRQHYVKRAARIAVLKEQAFALVGSKCARCGFDDRRALQFDHINGGGRKHRQTEARDRESLLKYVLTSPDQVQVLCANCNVIKRHEQHEGIGFGSLRETEALWH